MQDAISRLVISVVDICPWAKDQHKAQALSESSKQELRLRAAVLCLVWYYLRMDGD